MNLVLSLEAPTLDTLPTPQERKPISSYRPIPFLRLNPSRISDIFRKTRFLSGDKFIVGARFRKEISPYYQHLRGKLATEEMEPDEVSLMTEWSMIALIFYGASLSPALNAFISWLHSFSIGKENVGPVALGKDSAPHLWNALATVAAGRLLADPRRDKLPNLERWIEAKLSVESVLDEIEAHLDNWQEISSLFLRLKLCLEYSSNVPHGHLFGSEIGRLLESLAVSGKEELPAFYRYNTFIEVKHFVNKPVMSKLRGPDLMADRALSLNSLFTLDPATNVYLEADPHAGNYMRKRGWNVLMNKYNLSFWQAEDLPLLLDWAYMAVVCTVGLTPNSGPRKLIHWLQCIPFFNSNKQKPDPEKIKLLYECKQANAELWNAMVEYSIARVREDPEFRDFNPYSNLPAPEEEECGEDSVTEVEIPGDTLNLFDWMPAGMESRKWIPALDQSMKHLLSFTGVASLPIIDDAINTKGYYTIPFVKMDPPRIAELFRWSKVLHGKREIKGTVYRKHIALQYRYLGGKIEVSGTEEQVSLITEWAMITLIFHGSNLPKSHSPYVTALRSIPMDSMKLKFKRKHGAPQTLKQSVEQVKKIRNVNVKFWDALAEVAAGRLLADPERESLPLFEDWCRQKGILPSGLEILE